MRFSSFYRKYNQNIPQFLVNRLRHLVVHCMERWEVAKNIPKGHITIIDDVTGEFKEKSQLEQTVRYNLQFGDPSSMPKCECPDWLQTFLPCKHFLSKHDRCKTKDVAIILYCSCRMPWQKADDSDSAMQMAQCDNCLEWFHHCCEKIPDNIFVNNLFWECYKCQKKG